MIQAQNARPNAKQRDQYYWSSEYRYKAVISSELIDYCKRLSRAGKTAGEISIIIQWPPHKSLKLIQQWVK